MGRESAPFYLRPHAATISRRSVEGRLDDRALAWNKAESSQVQSEPSAISVCRYDLTHTWQLVGKKNVQLVGVSELSELDLVPR